MAATDSGGIGGGRGWCSSAVLLMCNMFGESAGGYGRVNLFVEFSSFRPWWRGGCIRRARPRVLSSSRCDVGQHLMVW